MKPLRRGRPARLTVVALAIMLQGTALLAQSAPALADQWDDAGLAYALVNDSRTWEGLPPLAWDDGLAWVAQSWADELAWSGGLAHNPSLADQLGGWWWSWGENVGYGPSVYAVHDAFVASWGHWLNIVEPSYTSVGVGIAYGARGRVYVVHVFAGSSYRS